MGCATCAHIWPPEVAPIKPGATRPAAGAVGGQGVHPRWIRAT
ncbi:conserved domain protein [Actinomyces sp. oral taxon 170 str. F0386]|nr:conserved domain protein [Actinomyces sp. oral taxon 170 str. F0386]